MTFNSVKEYEAWKKANAKPLTKAEKAKLAKEEAAKAEETVVVDK